MRRKKISLVLALAMCLTLCIPAFAKDIVEDSIPAFNYEEMFVSAASADGALADDYAYELYNAFEQDPMGFVSAASELPDEMLLSISRLLPYYPSVYLSRDDFENSIISFKESHELTASEENVINKILQAVSDGRDADTSIDHGSATLSPVPQFNPQYLDTLIDTYFEVGNYDDEELNQTFNEVYRLEPALFSSALENLTTVQLEKIASGIALDCSQNNLESVTIDASDASALSNKQIDVLNVIEEEIEAAENSEPAPIGVELTPRATQVPTIGAILYQGSLTCGIASKLNVTYTETTASSTSRTYWTEVYGVRNGTAYLKASGSVVIPSGSTSKTQSYSIAYSNTGPVYTLVKVYASQNGTMLTSRQGASPDTVTGKWYINVNLPVNRDYLGSLSLYHANGALQKTCECLGKSQYNTAMTATKGNTPTGTYSSTIVGKGSPESSYGPYERINMVGLTGIAKTSGRSGIMIHGGDLISDTSSNHYPLGVTNGCIRVTNTNQQQLVSLIHTLINNFYATSTGTVTVTQG